ncbi:MAG: M48 family metallopeptidase [Firmicutes bacterium]|nr:M48 family metallopeptidase [Bacillota bacterium]
MKFTYNDVDYPVVIEKKKTNRNTYIRVNKELTIKVTTNYFTSDKTIIKLLNDSYKSIAKMIDHQLAKNDNNEGFFYLGKKYDIVYVDYTDISIGESKVFLNKKLDLDKWYKKEAKELFKERLDYWYNNFSRNIPYPSLRIRKMTSRWGVCNTKLKVITLNLELIKRDIKYLDYVIVHELSHLIHANHSKDFWNLVDENIGDHRKYRREMKEF